MKKTILIIALLFGIVGYAQEKTELRIRQEQRVLEIRKQFTMQFNEADSVFNASELAKPFLLTDEEMKLIVPQTNLSLVLHLVKAKPQWYKFRQRKNWRKKLKIINTLISLKSHYSLIL